MTVETGAGLVAGAAVDAKGGAVVATRLERLDDDFVVGAVTPRFVARLRVFMMCCDRGCNDFRSANYEKSKGGK